MRTLARRIANTRHPAIADVEVAFLELAEPSITDGLARCVAKGAKDILVLPYFLAAGTHVTYDIPEDIAAFCAKHPQMNIRVTPHLGAAPTLSQAILDLAVSTKAQAA